MSETFDSVHLSQFFDVPPGYVCGQNDWRTDATENITFP